MTGATRGARSRRSPGSRFVFPTSTQYSITTGDDSFHSLSCLGVVGKRGVLHALLKFEATRGFGRGLRNCFVDVDGHGAN